jgi:hypothetical protein
MVGRNFHARVKGKKLKIFRSYSQLSSTSSRTMKKQNVEIPANILALADEAIE